MRVEVKLFAGLAERVGARSIELDIPDDADVKVLREYIVDSYPFIERDLQSAVTAINKQYAEPYMTVKSTDEVALIPPVGGG